MAVISPGVSIKEIDLTNQVPQLPTSVTGMVGRFTKGPKEDRTLVTSVQTLEDVFGKPTDDNFIDWYNAYNILQYNQNLWVVGLKSDEDRNAGLGLKIDGVYSTDNTITLYGMDTALATVGAVVTLSAGGVTVSGSVFTTGSTTSVINLNSYWSGTTGTVNYTVGVTTATAASLSAIVVSDVRINDTVDFDIDQITFNSGEKVRFLAKYPGLDGNNIKISICNSASFTSSLVTISTGNTFNSYFDSATIDTEDMAIIVQYPDPDDIPNYMVVETFVVSTDPAKKNFNGESVFVGEYITRNSNYIAAYSGATTTFTVFTTVNVALSGGQEGNVDQEDVQTAYDQFQSVDEFDVNILTDYHGKIGGSAITSVTLASIQNYVIDLAETRQDCFVVCSPPKADCVNNANQEAEDIATYKTSTLNKSSSYYGLYGNWKYQYDRYNDKYRWLPVSGDVAGIFGRNDFIANIWDAPAGFNRGQMKNVVKFGWNPTTKALRDQLSKNKVNIVMNFAGDGPIVYDELTGQVKDSAFGSVSVRRLFMYMEKSISQAMKYFLMQKNTPFTRRQVYTTIDPFLADLKANGALTDYALVCDDTNNGGNVIDAGELKVGIYVKPTRTIRGIELVFVNTKTGVDFKEIIR